MQPKSSDQPSFISQIASFFNLNKLDCVSVLLWTLGVLLMSVLLALDFMPLLTEYKDNNEETRIAVVRNGTSRPPNLTVCVPYHSGSIAKIAKWLIDGGDQECLECEALTNHSWDVWNGWNVSEFRNQQNKLESTLAGALVNKILDHGFEILDPDHHSEIGVINHQKNSEADNRTDLKSIDLLDINHTNFNWNQPLIDSIKTLFDCIRWQDFTFLINTSIENEEGEPECSSFNYSLTNRLTKNILTKLYDHLIDAVNVYMKIEVSPAQTADVGLRGRNPLTTSYYQLCFPLLQNSRQEIFTFSAFASDMDPPWKRSRRRVQFEVWSDTRVLYDEQLDWAEAVYSTDTTKMEEINQENVDILFDIDTKVAETRPDIKCIRDEDPPIRCLIKRQVEQTLKKCGCIPFGYREFIENSTFEPVCVQNLYKKCDMDLKLHHRQEKCNNKCEHTFYTWKYHVVTSDKESSQMKFLVLVLPGTPSPYLEFRVAVKDTPEKFLSQVGGLVNLYLGFSGLSACAFIILCIDMIKQRWAKKNAQNQGAAAKNRVVPSWITREVMKEMQKTVTKELMMAMREEIRVMKQELENKCAGSV